MTFLWLCSAEGQEKRLTINNKKFLNEPEHTKTPTLRLGQYLSYACAQLYQKRSGTRRQIGFHQNRIAVELPTTHGGGGGEGVLTTGSGSKTPFKSQPHILSGWILLWVSVGGKTAGFGVREVQPKSHGNGVRIPFKPAYFQACWKLLELLI